jgi:predicted transcriptional regulator
VRITVEITDEQRLELQRLAVRRGKRGPSTVLREAVERYLEAEAERDDLVKLARGVRGTWSKKDADAA